MAENQETIIVKNQSELEAETKRLSDEGWHIKKHPWSFRSLLFLSQEDIAATNSITFERNGEYKVVKLDNALMAFSTGLIRVNNSANKIRVVILFVVIFALIIIFLSKI